MNSTSLHALDTATHTTPADKTLHIVVDEAGGIAFIHDDDLVELLSEGEAHIERASHVEPDASGQWSADLSPVDGPPLGPFRLRGDALRAEVDWLHSNHL